MVVLPFQYFAFNVLDFRSEVFVNTDTPFDSAACVQYGGMISSSNNHPNLGRRKIGIFLRELHRYLASQYDSLFAAGRHDFLIGDVVILAYLVHNAVGRNGVVVHIDSACNGFSG